MTKEEQIRKKVKRLQRFYMNVINYFVFNTIFTLTWYIFDHENVFWPKYVMFIWGLVLFFKAYKIGILPFVSEYTTFLTSEWEEKKIRELMGEENKKPIPTKVPLKRHAAKKPLNTEKKNKSSPQ